MAWQCAYDCGFRDEFSSDVVAHHMRTCKNKGLTEVISFACETCGAVHTNEVGMHFRIREYHCRELGLECQETNNERK